VRIDALVVPELRDQAALLDGVGRAEAERIGSNGGRGVDGADLVDVLNVVGQARIEELGDVGAGYADRREAAGSADRALDLEALLVVGVVRPRDVDLALEAAIAWKAEGAAGATNSIQLAPERMTVPPFEAVQSTPRV